ncbi:hypothetical protein [Eisenibacter elegans]|uniref:hypothetical protein n=1 Tax=Eisenibacter elegans TaxID=997 RepID=UPI000416C48E|nr:hypothetical protein [Eisenibacter elegans]
MVTKLSFDTQSINPDYQFYFQNPDEDSVIFKIRDTYRIATLREDSPKATGG